MNILQLVPKLNIGGVEKGTVEVARHLTLNGHKAVVVSGGGEYEKSLAALGARHYKLAVGCKNPFVMFYCYLKLRRIIKKENIDIVHARSRIPALIGYFAAKVLDRVFITTAHGQYKKHLISRVMGWGKIVITANETMARYMKENFEVPLRKIVIIPRGVDLKKFSFTEISEKEKKVFRIGMVSRFTPLKGHLDFLKAVAYLSRKMPNIEAVMMGDRKSAKEEYMKKIDLAIRQLTLSGIVRFKDSSLDVARVLESFNVFVSANMEQEAFGRSIIEAQSRGIPVVATKVGGVVESVIDGETGLLCEPKNPRDLADKILRYAENASFAGEMALKARKYVEENYSLDKAMKMTLEAYTKVIGMKNILIFKISALGDVILSVPSLRAIRKRFPKAVIKILVDVRFREVLDGSPYIDEVITCDLNGKDSGAQVLLLAKRLRSEDFDISIDFQNSRKSHLLGVLSMIPERYGYDNGKWSFFLNRKISPPKEPMGPVEHQAGILGILGVTEIDKTLELWPKSENREWVEKFLKSNWLKKEQKLVGVNLSASHRWKTKNWGLSSVAELVEVLANEGIRVIVLGMEKDMPYMADFMRKITANRPIDAVGKTNISRLVSLIERCDALVTGDSAPMHIASSVGTPFAAIFGPTDPSRHVNPRKAQKILYSYVKCSPCYKPVCSKHLKCMTSIKPTEVFNALMEIMRRGG